MVGKGRPSQVFLRRAVSSLYYALFHHLARCCADTPVGGNGAARSKPAWRQVYRALEHGVAKNACKHNAVIERFPPGIRSFARTFVEFQEKRHSADYDPSALKLQRSEIYQAIKMAETAIEDFDRAALQDRRAFAAHVLLKQRP